MPERRAWNYQTKRQSGSDGEERLVAALSRQGKASGEPVLLTLSDLTLDAGLSAREAVGSLNELMQKGLITVSPVPEVRHIGHAIVYAVWIQPPFARVMVGLAHMGILPGHRFEPQSR